MREIKFRAWDKEQSIILFGVQKCYDSEVQSFGHILNEMIVNDEGLTDEKRFVPMQYTGLKDKNGKEIYFDDYVKTILHVYKIKQSKFKISLVNILNGDIIDLSNKILIHLTVIGNIYEDREEDIKKHCYIQKNT